MTVNYHPDNVEQTALWRGTMQVTLQGPVGHIFPVHIPIVDLPRRDAARGKIPGIERTPSAKDGDPMPELVNND